MKKSKLRKIIRESIKQLMTEQSPPNGGIGFYTSAKLYDCSQTMTMGNGSLQGKDVPLKNSSTLAHNFLVPDCVYITHNGQPWDWTVGGFTGAAQPYLVTYQGTLYSFVGTSTSATAASCAGTIHNATLVNGNAAPNYDPNGPTCSSPSFACPGCNGGNHIWGNMQNWENTFDQIIANFIQNSPNPLQPCLFLQQKIDQFTTMQSGIINQCNAFWNQLECKIKHATILQQQNNC